MQPESHNLFANEKPINQETYVFRHYKKTPPEQQSVTKSVRVTPEINQRIENYARKRGCCYSHALHYLLDTKEAAEMEPPVIIDWVEHARQKYRQYFVTHNLLGLTRAKRPKKKTKEALPDNNEKR